MAQHFRKIINTVEEFTGLSIVLGILLIVFLFFQSGVGPLLGLPWGNGGEIEQIKATTDLDTQVKFYKQLIERVGPTEAQEDLLKSGLPFTGQTHLLNHTVGDYLYEKYGAKGLSQCKDYFLSSCYHGFILHAIGVGGMPEVKKTFTECLPYGSSVYSQCAHAIGHGFLANAGYKNLTEALKLCDAIGQGTKDFPLFNCYDGVFMENVWGIHDGRPAPDRWVNESDIFYPCNDSRIDKKYLMGCWSNQPSLVYQFLNGDVQAVAARLCLKVEDPALQEQCFNGLARQIHPIAAGNLKKTFELCGLMPNTRWKNYCLGVNASSSFSVGDRSSPYEVCQAVDTSGKSECYGGLFNTMRAYARNKEEYRLFCGKVTEDRWKQACLVNTP